MPDAFDARSQGSALLAYSPPVSTTRPRPALRSFALRSWFEALGRSRRWRAAGLTFALVLAIYWRFADAPPAMVAGHAALSAPVAQPLQSVARSPVAAPPRPASSAAQSQPLKRPAKAPRATTKRWLPLPAARLEAGARDAPASPGHGVVVLSSALGWADIYEGSKKLGTTPLRVQLSSGLHRLTVRPYGEGPTRVMTLALRPAQTVKLDIALQW